MKSWLANIEFILRKLCDSECDELYQQKHEKWAAASLPRFRIMIALLPCI